MALIAVCIESCASTVQEDEIIIIPFITDTNRNGLDSEYNSKR